MDTTEPTYTPDHPHTREHGRCPICHNFKTRGLLVCWTCYRALGLRDECPAFVAAILDDTENTLTALERLRHKLTTGTRH